MAKIRNVEFADQNSVRRYPLAVTASAQDTTGTFKLPDDFLVGLSIPINWRMSVRPERFLIREVTNLPNGVVIVIGYDNESTIQQVARAVIPSSTSATQYRQVQVSGLGNFADSRGTLMIGNFSTLAAQPIGKFTFNLAGGALEPDCIKPDIKHIAGVYLNSSGNLSDLMTGALRLRAGRNIRLTATLLDTNEYRVTIDAISGEGLTELCVCYTDTPPIKTISGVPPVNGAIEITAGSCVEISTGQALIAITDTCSKPCCGPEDLERVTAAAEAVGTRITTAENQLNRLEALVQQANLIMLSSKLGDRGCNPECP